MSDSLAFQTLREAVVGRAAAFRAVTRYQPAGGPGSKVFPPTYAGGVYHVERRRVRDEVGAEQVVTCIVLDSVQSQANRMEEALQDAIDEGRIELPLIVVDFSDADLLDPVGRVTSLQAPHRIADAILRDSEFDGERFRKSEHGRRIDAVDLHNATALYDLCPTALVFGAWDSTGPKGGLGAKFARAIVSEIVAVNAQAGADTGSRIDPLGIRADSGDVYRAADDDGWTLDPERAATNKKGQPIKVGDGKPSELNHGNVTPDYTRYDSGAISAENRQTPDLLRDDGQNIRGGRIRAGGITMSHALQTTVLSLPTLRRLKFPPESEAWSPSDEQRRRDEAARTVLAALGLSAATLAAERGADLRSRCLLWPTEPMTWELLDRPGAEPRAFELDGEAATELLGEAVSDAERAGVEWRTEELALTPSSELVALLRKSQERAAAEGQGSEA